MAVNTRVIGILVGVLIIGGVMLVAFGIIESTKELVDKIDESNEQSKEMLELCDEWLSGGAFVSNYPPTMVDATGVLSPTWGSVVCPAKWEVSDTSQLFDCRVACVLAVKAKEKCEDDPTFYNDVTIPSALSGDSYVTTKVSESALQDQTDQVEDVAVSQCQSRILFIIANLPETGTPSTEFLHDCEVKNKNDCECKRWRGEAC